MVMRDMILDFHDRGGDLKLYISCGISLNITCKRRAN